MTRGRPKGIKVRVCEYDKCGKRFESARSDKRFCNRLCRYQARNDELRELAERGRAVRA